MNTELSEAAELRCARALLTEQRHAELKDRPVPELIRSISHELISLPQPVLVLNKADLKTSQSDAEVWAALYRSVGYRVLITSAPSAMGISELHEELCSGISALIGPSGAGKSTLLNMVDPGLEPRTGAFPRATGP